MNEHEPLADLPEAALKYIGKRRVGDFNLTGVLSLADDAVDALVEELYAVKDTASEVLRMFYIYVCESCEDPDPPEWLETEMAFANHLDQMLDEMEEAEDE